MVLDEAAVDNSHVGDKSIHLQDDPQDKTSDISHPIDTQAEKKLLRTLDLWIIPPVMLLYLFSFLDRVNIGNARLYGLEKDLGLVGNQYQIAVSILFVTYILSELPSNLVLKKFRPSRWLAFITTGWGLVATLTGISQSYGGLIACRLILGALEGGLFPGLAVYLTLFYGKREIALRVGYLFVSAAISGSVGGLLAYGVGHMDGIAGLRGWRWILIIEGIPTFLLGISIWWWLADEPETAHYLTFEEKQLLTIRKRRQTGYIASADEFHKADVYKAVKDWKVWAFCAGQFGSDTILYGYSTFLPTIIKGLGSWTPAQVQCLTIPCYALGAVTYLVMAWISDRYQKRGIVTVTFGLISVVGYAILLANVSSGVHYFGCFVVAMGLYVVVGIPLGWLPANNPRYGARTTATGLQLTCGNLSGIMAPFLYSTNDAPRYVRGHAVSLSMVAFAAIVYGFMSFWLKAKNVRRMEGKEDYKIEGMNEVEINELGPDNPRFMYTY